MNIVQKLRWGAWALSALVVALAVLAWGQGNRWDIDHISTYNLFPIFGLVAFSLMWTHYIAAAARAHFKVEKSQLHSYFEATSIVVLICILLHPGLLIWQLFHDGFGLPPGSYLNNYVAPNAKWAALFGSVSLIIFLAYEFHRIYDKKPWWKYMQYLSDIAMILIFVHALKLGRQLGMDWFRAVWWVYGITLLGSIIYMYALKLKQKPSLKK